MKIDIKNDGEATVVCIVDPSDPDVALKTCTIPQGSCVCITCLNEHDADGIEVGEPTSIVHDVSGTQNES